MVETVELMNGKFYKGKWDGCVWGNGVNNIMKVHNKKVNDFNNWLNFLLIDKILNLNRVKELVRLVKDKFNKGNRWLIEVW